MAVKQITREQMKLLLQPAVSHTRKLRRFDVSVSWIGLLGAALIYASINIPAIISVNRAGNQRLAPTPIADTIPTAQAAPTDTPQSTATSADASNPTPAAPAAFTYDKVGISAPIQWDVPYDTYSIKVALQSGLAHVKGSAQPGSNGTTIITGHSSNTAWAKGSYKNVFAPLLQSKLSDTFTVHYSDTTYEYKVSQVYEVEPTRTDLLAGTTGVQMRLITCTPLGTDKRRLIIDATQINPNPTGTWQANDINATTIVAAR